MVVIDKGVKRDSTGRQGKGYLKHRLHFDMNGFLT